MPLFGPRRSAEEQEPLLPRSIYEDDTALQRKLHQKLHTYQMIRAICAGFMPSNEQAIILLRTLAASDCLNPTNRQISGSGRAVAHFSKQLLGQLIYLLRHKNSEDQIQDIIWFLSPARLSSSLQLDLGEVRSEIDRANTQAVLKSLQTVGSLAMGNSEFRLFLSDLGLVGREIFKDTAFALSTASREAGRRVELSAEEQRALAGRPEDGDAVSAPEDIRDQTTQVTDVIAEGVSKVAESAGDSISKNLSGREKEVLLSRLKEAVVQLRRRPSYSDSISTLSLLLQRYMSAYSDAVDVIANSTTGEVLDNTEMDRALRSLYQLVSSFGDPSEWKQLETKFETIVTLARENARADDLVRQAGNYLQELLTDPAFFDNADQSFQNLRMKYRELTCDPSFGDAFSDFLKALQSVVHSALQDKDIAAITETTLKVFSLLFPDQQGVSRDIRADLVHFFVPTVVRSLKYLPIPRLEISNPRIDLLLENIILESGSSINDSSFMPYKLRVETFSDIEIRKARFRTTSSARTLMRIKIDGLSMRAEELGFWFKARFGPLRLLDEGIASFQLDERGFDLHMELEVGKDQLESLLTLNEVKVHIHKLDWSIRRSKFSLWSWLFKPILRPLVRKTIESQISSAIANGLHVANREILYARERLRATRIADPDDVRTFLKAVLARLVPQQNPDTQMRVGFGGAGEGVFKGIYTPGSLTETWDEQAIQASARIRENERGGWRDDIFDVNTVLPQ